MEQTKSLDGEDENNWNTIADLLLTSVRIVDREIDWVSIKLSHKDYYEAILNSYIDYAIEVWKIYLTELNNQNKAAEYFNRALEYSPNDPQTLMDIWVSYVWINEPVLALQSWRDALINFDENSPECANDIEAAANNVILLIKQLIEHQDIIDQLHWVLNPLIEKSQFRSMLERLEDSLPDWVYKLLSGPDSDKESMKYGYEQVLEAYTQLQAVTQVSHPDDLDCNDPKVKRVEDMFYKWIEDGDISDHEFNYLVTMLRVRAGFNHPDYLDEIANDSLAQDLQNAESEQLDELALKIRNTIEEINNKL